MLRRRFYVDPDTSSETKEHLKRYSMGIADCSKLVLISLAHNTEVNTHTKSYSNNRYMSSLIIHTKMKLA